MKPNPAVYLVNVNNETEVDQFNQVLGNLMSNLKDEASLGYSYRKYATDNATATNFQTLYGMVQCTPDLSQQDCFDCLDRAVSQIPNCCNGKIGGRVLTPSKKLLSCELVQRFNIQFRASRYITGLNQTSE